MSDTFDVEAWLYNDDPIAVSEPDSTDEVPAPVTDALHTDEPAADEVAVDENVTEAEPDSAVAPETPPAPVVDWNSPENPHFQEAETLRQIKARATQLKAQQDNEALRNTLADVVDGDPEKNSKLHGALAQIITPITQRVQAAERDAHAGQKTLSALVMTIRNELPEEQQTAIFTRLEKLMKVEGVDAMQGVFQEEKAISERYGKELTKATKQIADLERRIAAMGDLAERQITGADRVDGGTGSVLTDKDPLTAMRDADNFDDFWSAATRRVQRAAS